MMFAPEKPGLAPARMRLARKKQTLARWNLPRALARSLLQAAQLPSGSPRPSF
jgi:hypothetical protein